MSDECPFCEGEWGECECSRAHEEVEPRVKEIVQWANEKGWDSAQLGNACGNVFMWCCEYQSVPFETLKNSLDRMLKNYAINLEKKTQGTL